MEQIKLYECALYVRENIEYCKNINKGYSDFPYGYCAKASLWLYDYLYFNGYRDMEIRMKDPFICELGIGNHVWLFYKGYNLDITADQFNRKGYNFDSVYVSNDPNLYYDSYNEIVVREHLINDFFASLMYEQGGFSDKWNYLYKSLGISFEVTLKF